MFNINHLSSLSLSHHLYLGIVIFILGLLILLLKKGNLCQLGGTSISFAGSWYVLLAFSVYSRSMEAVVYSIFTMFLFFVLSFLVIQKLKISSPKNHKAHSEIGLKEQ